VVQTPFGRVGGLNCWEHTQTLLRYYEYQQDVDIHVSSWPLIWEKHESMGDWVWHISAEACGLMSQFMAMEGACFVMICSQVMSEKNKEKNGVKDWAFAQCPGGGFSMIFGPGGEKLVERLDAGEEGILYADVDLAKKILAKQNLDVVGHYSRPDLLSLRVTKDAAHPVHFA
jgi:nitrilase